MGTYEKLHNETKEEDKCQEGDERKGEFVAT